MDSMLYNSRTNGSICAPGFGKEISFLPLPLSLSRQLQQSQECHVTKDTRSASGPRTARALPRAAKDEGAEEKEEKGCKENEQKRCLQGKRPRRGSPIGFVLASIVWINPATHCYQRPAGNQPAKSILRMGIEAVNKKAAKTNVVKRAEEGHA